MRTGNRMAAVQLSDPSGSYEGVLFSEGLTQYRELLEPGKSVEGATWTGREDAEDEVGASFERAKGTPYEHHHVNLA